MNDAQKTAEMTNRCEIQTPVVPVRQSRLPSHHTKLLTPNLERSFTTRELDCTDVELPRLAEFQLHLDLHKNRHTTNLTLISESFTRIADMREPILDDATTEEALRLVSNLVSVTVELRAALDGTLNKLSVIEDEAEKLACQQSLLELSLQSLQSLADSSEETVERLITLGILCDRNSGASTTSPAFLVGAEADSRSSHPDERVYQSTSRNPAQVRSGSGAAPRRRSAPVEDSIKSRESTSIKAVLEKRCSVCTASPPRSNGSTSPNPSDGGSPSPSLSSPRHSASIARRPLDSPSARARASPNLPNKRK
ncbi:hypothetical protein BJ742DRAFT_789842 [Cladochytrium replicatum]|nr:hypothetical protein BJ742DRAFT_789842 [Cladochytrium replicatum]